MNFALHRPELEGRSFFWKGNKTGILLFHGLTATSAEVRLLATALHQENYTVSTPLLPGHGTSPEELSKTHRSEWLTCAEKAYHELKNHCSQIFVGGTSTGALIALHLAAHYPKICGILAYAPAMKLALHRWKQVLMVLASPLGLSVPKKNLEARALWQGYRVNPLKAGVQLLCLQQEILSLLPEIYHPILLIQGRNDSILHAKSSEIILQEVSSAVKKLCWMEHSGHVLLLEKEHCHIEQQTLDFIHQIHPHPHPILN